MNHIKSFKVFESVNVTIDEILYFFYDVIDDHNFHKIDFSEDGYDGEEFFDNHNYFAAFEFDSYVIFDFICLNEDIINEVIKSSKVIENGYVVKYDSSDSVDGFTAPDGSTKPHISIKISPKIIEESVNDDIDYHTQIIKEAFTDVIDEHDIYPWVDDAFYMSGIFYNIREERKDIGIFIRLVVDIIPKSFDKGYWKTQATEDIITGILNDVMLNFKKRIESIGYNFTLTSHINDDDYLYDWFSITISFPDVASENTSENESRVFESFDGANIKDYENSKKNSNIRIIS